MGKEERFLEARHKEDYRSSIIEPIRPRISDQRNIEESARQEEERICGIKDTERTEKLENGLSQEEATGVEESMSPKTEEEEKEEEARNIKERSSFVSQTKRNMTNT